MLGAPVFLAKCKLSPDSVKLPSHENNHPILLPNPGLIVILDGRDVADYIKERHAREASRLATQPHLAIVRQGASAATDMYLRVKQRYGTDIGVAVDIYTETAASLLERVAILNADASITAINVELPFVDAPELTDQALAAVVLDKDVEGLAPGSSFELPTAKGVHWLLGAYNLIVKGPITVVGQGRLVGRPLADDWEAMGLEVRRCDDTTPDLASAVRGAALILSATGQPGIIKNDWVASGTIVIDAGAGVVDGKLAGDLEPALYSRQDISVTPNPGGVGPMTVAALFDNVLMAAKN